MKRVHVFSLILLTLILISSAAMVGQADAVVITDKCIVDGSGTLADGVRFSGYVGPDENGDVNGTWEQWETCETITCDDYSGSLHGLCNAYCEAMNCTGDAPEASEVACERVRKNFFDKGGDRLPCEPCGNHFVGDADRMYCWRNGVVQADFWGTGSLNGEPGYSYGLHVQDFGDSGPDYYQLYIYPPDGGPAVWVEGGYLSSGNIDVPPMQETP